MPYRKQSYNRYYSKRVSRDVSREKTTNTRSLSLGIAGEFKIIEAKSRLVQQNGKCYYCGRKLSWYTRNHRADHKAIVEHYIPLSKGGRNHISNVVISCTSCNLSKSTKTGSEYMENRKRLGLKSYMPFHFSGSSADLYSRTVVKGNIFDYGFASHTVHTKGDSQGESVYENSLSYRRSTPTDKHLVLKNETPLREVFYGAIVNALKNLAILIGLIIAIFGLVYIICII
ncbi:HNH endonuclease [Deinococcus detaillensis]|nr:HNH endonuclease [Deinococcus detaillensis]